MTEPIKQGDRAHIIEGALGDQGPNIGKAVTVGKLRGEHSKHGRIWHVHGEGLITEYGATCYSLDCAAAWLRKIEPPPLKAKEVAEDVPTMREQLLDEHASGLDA